MIAALVAGRRIIFGLSVAVFGPFSGCADRRNAVEVPAITGRTTMHTFSAAHVGKLPPEVYADQTGKGTGGDWKVVADDSAPSKTGYVLAQTGESRRSVFNLCITGKQRYRDLKLSVALKAVSGMIDQGGGIVWRYLDANNYYVCRYNPLEENLRIYRVIAGRRTQLASADTKLQTGQWHALTVVMKDDLIVADVNGTQIDVRDDTISSKGRVGFWTKADAQTHFDKLKVIGNPE